MKKWQQIPPSPILKIDTIWWMASLTQEILMALEKVLPLLRGDPSSRFHMA